MARPKSNRNHQSAHKLSKPPPLYGERDFSRVQPVATRLSTGLEPYRSDFRRDYARLIHSPAFRRLQGKTQVFPGDESDFFRNRLTHSLEVAQISKSIAAKVNAADPYFADNPINLDLMEFAGLAHDLGHPPFGHNGEKALDERMKGFGGFEGNAQTFRILARIEKKEVIGSDYVGITPAGEDCRLGLNLSFRTLASILKYDNVIPLVRPAKAKIEKGVFDSERSVFEKVRRAVGSNMRRDQKFKTIECAIMDIADDIAYSTYDLEDTFKAGFLSPLKIIRTEDGILDRVAKKTEDELKRKVTREEVKEVFVSIFDIFEPDENWKRSGKDTRANVAYQVAIYHRMSGLVASNGYLRTGFTADLVSRFIAGIRFELDGTRPALSKVYLEDRVKLEVEILKHFTFEATIMVPRLRISEQRGFDIIKRMFDKLAAKNGHLLLPDDFREQYVRLKDEAAKKRVICDFIAGMTDRYAVEFYGRIFSENPQSIFKPF